MFSHADRFPTGPALPSGIATPRPWALRRMRPYPGWEAPGYARAVLDPETQTTRYFDEAGRPVEMGKHGTSTGTKPPTGTGGPDGNGPSADTDYGSDNDQ